MNSLAKHVVKCFYCGKSFDTNLEPWVKPNSKRYAHELCHQRAIKEHEQENVDKEALYDYIKNLFGYEIIPTGVLKQIKKYIEENHYTYSGILKTLKYFYEVKHGNKEKSGGRIGIVEYCYEDARRYYYEIWQAQEINKDKPVENFVPVVQEIKITPPKRTIMGARKNLFAFLEEEVEKKT